MSWQRQELSQPLFANLLWSKPENKHSAGKLLIIGGQKDNFALPSKAYQASTKARAGTVNTLLPDSLQKVAQALPGVNFAPSNKSGSFARTALGEWFEQASWADRVLLAGDLGKNSETTTIIDGFLLKYSNQTTLSLDALKSSNIPLAQIINMPLTLVIDFVTLQKIGIEVGLLTPLQSTMPIANLAETLGSLTSKHRANIVLQHSQKLWVASGQQTSSTPTQKPIDNSELSAVCSVWQMQNPTKPFEALTTACYEYLGMATANL